jgi:hypothetical protein
MRLGSRFGLAAPCSKSPSCRTLLLREAEGAPVAPSVVRPPLARMLAGVAGIRDGPDANLREAIVNPNYAPPVLWGHIALASGSWLVFVISNCTPGRKSISGCVRGGE